MLKIEFTDNHNDSISFFIDIEFNKYAIENDLQCNYKSFSFTAKENDELVGVITGHSLYKEVHISDFIVLKKHRNKSIGTRLIETVEEYYKNKEFENINLTTYAFQALEFYKKCGYKIEFIRKSKENPKLDKYFLVKYL